MPRLFLVFFLFFSGAAFSADFIVPKLTGPVVDQAQIIDAKITSQIENALLALHAQGGSQINVLTVDTLAGLTVEQASIKVTDQWKLGGKKQDNGVLLFVAKAEHKVRIEVGQGLEGVLPDAYCRRIIDEKIVPLFKQGDYGAGILLGVYEITKRTDPNIDLTKYFEGISSYTVNDGSFNIIIFLVIFIIFIFVNYLFGKLSGGRGYWGRGGWGGGSWGGGLGGSSGGFGGGWSGGGGGFSGGGASGSW